MEKKDRLLDAVEDLAVLEFYLSQVCDCVQRDVKQEISESPCLHNSLLTEYLEDVVKLIKV